MRPYLYRLWGTLATAFFLLSSLQAQDSIPDTRPHQHTKVFTDNAPLVYEDAWDLWPYAFLNEQGEPDGYNIDLVRRLMNELDIPYIIKLKSRRNVLQDMNDNVADLTMGMYAHFHNSFGYYGKSTVQLFTHSVLTPLNQPVTIHSLNDLGRQEVIVHVRSYSHHLMNEKGWGQNAIPFDDMKEAVQKVSTDGKGQILWNTASLKWIMRMYHIDNLQLTPVDMPHGEYKFISKDTLLLNRLDRAFAKIRANGKLEDLQTKWFYPERKETGIPSWVWYFMGIVALIALGLTLLYLTYRQREMHMRVLTHQRTHRLAQILQACHVRIWTYNVDSQIFTWMNRNGQPQHTYTSLEFARRYHHRDFERLYNGIQQVVSQQQKTVTLELTDQDDDEGLEGERTYQIVLSVLRSEQGKPSVIIGTRIDITEEKELQQRTKEQLMRYASVFNNVMVDMAYYDENGYLTNMNDRMQKTFGFTLQDAINRKMNVMDILGIDSLDELDNQYSTQLPVHGIHNKGFVDNYYECQFVPVRDKDGKLLCIYSTGRRLNETVNTYHRIRQSIKELQKATNEVTDYVNNINYVLGVGGVRLANYSPDTHTLTTYRGLNTVELTLTQSRCMTLVDEESKKQAMKMLNSMDARKSKAVELEVKTTLRRRGIPLYVQIHFIPVFNNQNVVQEYFGLCRDISDLKHTDALLQKETVRAQEVEGLKNSFLKNMSYEIRTPLNAVVGFSELFEMEHAPEDEPLFIKEIKDNSARLLNLINDILFLSRLDAHMIEMERHPIDFAQTFDGYCHMGWANYQKEGVAYQVENHYNQLVVDIDDTNLGRIIEQVTANAAQHTASGTVRARYDYITDKLMIAIEDTGCGMSKEVLDHVYEHFASSSNNGTGLGLPICKELAEQMGGTIDISSEEGKGTTVWITMPCQATVIERKKNI